MFDQQGEPAGRDQFPTLCQTRPSGRDLLEQAQELGKQGGWKAGFSETRCAGLVFQKLQGSFAGCPFAQGLCLLHARTLGQAAKEHFPTLRSFLLPPSQGGVMWLLLLVQRNPHSSC